MSFHAHSRTTAVAATRSPAGSALAAAFALAAALAWVSCTHCAGGEKPEARPSIQVPVQLTKSWHVVGPFPLGENPVRTSYPPEQKVDLQTKYTGRKEQVAWEGRREDRKGTVWLHQDFGEDFVAYAYAEFQWEDEEAGYLFMGSDDGIVVWLNGKKVLEKDVNRALLPGEDKVLVEFAKGKNQILIKLIQRKMDAGFNVRALPSDLARLDPALRVKILLDEAKRHRRKGEPEKALALLEGPMYEIACGRWYTELFVELCVEHGSLARAAAALAAQGKFHSGGYRTAYLSHAASLYVQAEDARAATELVKAIEKETKRPENGLRRSIGLAEHRASVLLPEAMGVDDTLTFIRNTIASGAHREAAVAFREQMEALRDTVVLLEDRIGLSTPGYMKRVSRDWGTAFHEELTRLAGTEAKSRLASADGNAPSVEATVLELFGESAPARRLAEHRASELLDSGNAARAALWYSESSKRSKSAQLKADCALALASAGCRDVLSGFVSSLSEREKKAMVSVAGKMKTLTQAIGDFERNIIEDRTQARSLPDRLGAGWRRYLSRGTAARGLTGIGRNRRGPVVPATLVPGLDGTRLVVNTGTAVRAYDLKTGDPLWTCRPYDLTRMYFSYDRPSTPVPILGAETHNDIVFVRAAPSLSKQGILRETVLHALDVSSGRIVWSAADVRELNGQAVVSEPLVAYGTLFLVAARRGAAAMTLSAVALAPETGRVLWRRTLVSGSDSFGGESITSELPRPLLTPGGVVFATHMGVVAAADPLTGAIERLTTYERMGMGIRASSRYHVNPVFYSNGVIVTAPRDSDRVFGIRAASGKIIWSADRSRTPCLAGAESGEVFLAGGRTLIKLDIETGKEISRATTGPLGLLPVCSLNGSRLWIGGLDGLRVFDSKTLEGLSAPKGLDATARVVAIDDYVVSLSNDSELRVLPKDETVALRPGEHHPLRINLAKQSLAPCPSGYRPVLLWNSPDALENLCFPDSVHGFYPPGDYRGAFLSWNAYEVKLHDLNGFGQALWERALAGATDVAWHGNRVVAAVAGHVQALDAATGSEAWRHRCGDQPPHLTFVDGVLYFLGRGNRSVLCVEAGKGKVLWTSEIPNDLKRSRIAASGKSLYLVGRRDESTGPWDVRSLDGENGTIRELYSRAPKHHSERFVGIYGDGTVWTLGALAWAESLKDGKEIWQVKSPRWSVVASPAYDGDRGRRLLFLRVDRGDDAVLDPETGAKIVTRKNGHGPWTFHKHRADHYVWAFGKRIGSRIIRVKPDGGEGKPFWEYKANPWDWDWRHSMSACGDSVRAAWKHESWLRIANLDKSSGKLLDPHVIMALPGIEQMTWLYGGNFLLVRNPEGLRCFRMTDPETDVAAWAAQRRDSARKLPHDQDRARALAGIRVGTSMLKTLDVSWPAAKGPLSLDEEWFWHPVRHRGTGYRLDTWKGPEDLSARLTISTNRWSGTRIVLKIRDDHWEPFDGNDGGDHIRIVGGRIDTTFGAGPDGKVLWKDRNNKDPFGKHAPTASISEEGRTYELVVNRRFLSLRYHNVDTVVVADDDGDGPRGAMEWGTRFHRKSR